MKKKPKLLTTLLSGEKRRHHVAAYITQEADWNQHEPNTGFARMFIAMLILHVLIIGGIILSDSSARPKASPHSPAAQSLLTKSKDEITSLPPHSAASQAAGQTDGVKYETYEVRSGDSLPKIVARFGVEMDDLIALNKLDTKDGFSTGTVLRIPHKKMEAPLQISTARPLPALALVLPSSSTSEPDASVVEPESDSPPSADTNSALVLLTPQTEGTTGLVPLPEVAADVPSVSTTETPVADSPPPAISLPVVSKSDSVVSKAAPVKPAIKKPATTASKPRPVPTPSEMSSRPISKAPTTSAATKAATTYTMVKGDTLYRVSAQYGVSVASLIKANNVKDPGKLRDGTKLVIPAK